MPITNAAALPPHKTRHQTGGTDEVSIASLLGSPAQKAAASGLASLSAASLVVQKPADRLSKANFEITLNKLLKGAGVGADPTEVDLPGAGGVAIFGDGSDGDVVTAGGGAGNITLSRDMFYNNLTVTAGDTIKTGGFRIHVAGTLTNAGTIERNGTDGGNAVGAVAGAGGIALTAGSLGASAAGGNGGGGGSSGGGGGGGGGGGILLIVARVINNSAGFITADGGDGGNGNTAAGTGGTPGAAGDSITISAGANGGAGGKGHGDVNAGGAGGTVTAIVPAKGSFRATPIAILLKDETDEFRGGAGGGGGGQGQNAGEGGGGGGGGGGGLLVIISQVATFGGTETANGGAKGLKGGAARDGTAGSNGTVVKISS